jgi:hypothetical protein
MTLICTAPVAGLSGDLRCCAESDWVERCRASIGEREPLLDAADVLDLALTLWDLPRCRRLLPELAARLLLADQLGRMGLADSAG